MGRQVTVLCGGVWVHARPVEQLSRAPSSVAVPWLVVEAGLLPLSLLASCEHWGLTWGIAESPAGHDNGILTPVQPGPICASLPAWLGSAPVPRHRSSVLPGAKG